MFRENALKQRLRDGKKCLGCWLFTANSMVAEIVGQAGYDFVLIDNEHGAGSLLTSVQQLQGLSATPVTGMMRVPWNDPVYIKRALDTGIEGVMIPMVETAEDAADAVAACRYPPAGTRGCASRLIRASDYGRKNDEYLRRANDELLIMVQIESARAVENIAAIADVDGVDVLFIGPNDLAASIGLPGRTAEPAARALIDRAEDAIRVTGAKMAAVPYAGMNWTEMFERGYDLIAGNSDTGLLRDGASVDVAAHRQENG